MIGTIILIVIILFLLGILFSFIIMYNSIIRLKNNIEKAWSNIDVLLKQRSNEIQNLVSTVKGYMQHEQNTLESLTKARSLIDQVQSLSRKAAVNDVTSNLLKTLFAVAENYPDLKAGQNFLKLQNRISGLENEISDRREFYNDSVTIYNTRIQSIPDVFIARILKLKRVELFKATEEDKRYIEVNF